MSSGNGIGISELYMSVRRISESIPKPIFFSYCSSFASSSLRRKDGDENRKMEELEESMKKAMYMSCWGTSWIFFFYIYFLFYKKWGPQHVWRSWRTGGGPHFEGELWMDGWWWLHYNLCTVSVLGACVQPNWLENSLVAQAVTTYLSRRKLRINSWFYTQRKRLSAGFVSIYLIFTLRKK